MCLLFLYICKQALWIFKVRISKRVKGLIMRNLRGTFLYEGRCIAGFSYLHYYNVPLKSLATLTLLRLNMR